MKSFIYILYIQFSITFTLAAIIPEEVPSLLSLIYSNIPPVKKGTDSRLGVGFRLGEHADIQFLVELGPQMETRPLTGDSTSNKRHALPPKTDTLKIVAKTNQQEEDTISDTDGGKWLQSWYEKIKNQQNMKLLTSQTNSNEPSSVLPTLELQDDIVEGAGEIKASDVIPDDNENV